MTLIVGLGNPGSRYRGTRHNVGFSVVEELANRHGISIRRRTCGAAVGGGAISGVRVLLAKPQTFMNLSGEAVGALARYYGAPSERVWVVVDDVALPIGRIRMRLQGSDGGHNGLRSIAAHLGSTRYPRLRIGIGDAVRGGRVEHVLDRFAAAEAPIIGAAVRRAADAIETALAEGFERAMNRYNVATDHDAEQ